MTWYGNDCEAILKDYTGKESTDTFSNKIGDICTNPIPIMNVKRKLKIVPEDINVWKKQTRATFTEREKNLQEFIKNCEK